MYFYPRPPWGGRRCSSWPTVYSSLISIHALRGEGDTTHIQPPSLQSHFYPRPPWGGRRILTLRLPAHKRFLSTPSVGRATCSTATIQSAWPFLSTPSVGRATKIPAGCWRTRRISIHALRGEGDADTCRPGRESPDFYPRPPWGGRPRRSTTLSASTSISIHALRGEGDQLPFPSQCQRSRISIHALRGEGDKDSASQVIAAAKFLSTPSVGRATYRLTDALDLVGFLSTPSVGRATHDGRSARAARKHFYPRPPWGGRSLTVAARTPTANFYPRPPWGGRPVTPSAS